MSFQQQEWYRKPVDITNRMFYSKNHPIAKRKQTCVWWLYVSNITEKSSDKIHKINYSLKNKIVQLSTSSYLARTISKLNLSPNVTRKRLMDLHGAVSIACRLIKINP